MKGTILDFSIQNNNGIISGEDQKRYTFTGSEWKDSVSTQQRIKVILLHKPIIKPYSTLI